MQRLLSNYEMDCAYKAYKKCETLLNTAWGKRLWYTVPQLWQAVILPVRIWRMASLQAHGTAEAVKCYATQKATEYMAYCAPAVKHGLKTAILDFTDTETEPLLDMLLEIWEPFCAPLPQETLTPLRSA